MKQISGNFNRIHWVSKCHLLNISHFSEVSVRKKRNGGLNTGRAVLRNYHYGMVRLKTTQYTRFINNWRWQWFFYAVCVVMHDKNKYIAWFIHYTNTVNAPLVIDRFFHSPLTKWRTYAPKNWVSIGSDNDLTSHFNSLIHKIFENVLNE